jgi:hypothetical protein
MDSVVDLPFTNFQRIHHHGIQLQNTATAIPVAIPAKYITTRSILTYLSFNTVGMFLESVVGVGCVSSARTMQMSRLRNFNRLAIAGV